MSKVLKIVAPFAADIKDLKEIPDPVFAEKMMGDGIALDPKEGLIKAICDGDITIFHTKHAVTFASEGVEILLHFGIDTVQLDGEGFEQLTNSETVKQGEDLIKVDVDFVKTKVPSVLTPVVIPDDSNIEKIEVTDQKSVKAGDVLMTLYLK